MLTTALRAATCRNVVLVRPVKSMVEFKLSIRRGTCVRDAYGKPWFNEGNHAAEKVRTLWASPDEHAAPASNGGRAQSPEHGTDFASAAWQAGQPHADPFEAPVLTSRQRADGVKRKQATTFSCIRQVTSRLSDALLASCKAASIIQQT